MGKEFWVGKSSSRYKMDPYWTGNISNLEAESSGFGRTWRERALGEAAAARERDAGEYWGERQKAFGDALAAAASGRTPSAAELQMQAGLGRAQAAAQSAAAGMRGVSPGLAKYLASQQMGEQQAAITQQTGILRADETARAREAYSSFMAGARGQDLQTQQMQEELVQKYMAMGMSAEQAALQARMSLEAQRQQAWATRHSIQAGSYQPGSTGFLGNLATAFAGGLGQSLSDRREKKDIKKAKAKDIRKFADALAKHAYSFKYKGDAPTSDRSKKKKHFGVMAQDLEKFGGAVGRSIVETNRYGGMPAQPARKKEPDREVKTLDLQAGFGAALAAIGDLAGRVKALERG